VKNYAAPRLQTRLDCLVRGPKGLKLVAFQHIKGVSTAPARVAETSYRMPVHLFALRFERQSGLSQGKYTADYATDQRLPNLG